MLAALVALAAVLAGAYAVGYRLNLQTGSVPVPTATASPEDVVRSYAEAYDRRDFATMRAIYPSEQSAYSRFRVMGTMRNLQITRSRMVDKDPRRATRPGHCYALVSVTLDLTGLTGSDWAYDEGPNGWTYELERSSTAEPWTIVDHGNP